MILNVQHARLQLWVSYFLIACSPVVLLDNPPGYIIRAYSHVGIPDAVMKTTSEIVSCSNWDRFLVLQ